MKQFIGFIEPIKFIDDEDGGSSTPTPGDGGHLKTEGDQGVQDIQTEGDVGVHPILVEGDQA